MKKLRIGFLFFFLISLVLTACSGSNTPKADLNLMAGSNAKLFLGTDLNSDGLLKAFYQQEHLAISVTYLGGPEAEAAKNQALTGNSDYQAFMFDDQLFSKGLTDLSYPARSFVGVWVKKSKAEALGLGAGNNYLDHTRYGQLLESGNLKIVTANANQSTASALEFFATMSACTGNSGSALTVENVQSAKDCGKTIYDHYARSSGSTGDSVNMVFNDALQGTNMFDGVIAFQASFAGTHGLNSQLEAKGKEPFIFVYFSDASPVAAMALGDTGKLNDSQKQAYDKFVTFLLSEKSQQYINQQGLLSGSSAFGATPDYSSFKADWGMNPNPKVNPVNPPVYNVAKQALTIYTNLYKRPKDVEVCLDMSGSMSNNNVNVIDAKGQKVSVSRLQALYLATKKLTDNQGGSFILGPSDQISYSLFSQNTVGPVAQSTGTNTAEAGKSLAAIIGNDSAADQNITGIGVVRNGTAMFDCAEVQLSRIVKSYRPDVDYYIVLMTDGENNAGEDANAFLQSWQNQHKINITVMGISFGTDGSSVNSDYTVKFGGNTYAGNNDADLFNAFKQIFNR